MRELCLWCSKPVEVEEHFNRHTDVAFCTGVCESLEYLFRATYSDEEQNRRAHYFWMTRGIPFHGNHP